MSSSKFCFFHDPDTVEQRNAARKAGGRKHRYAPLRADRPDQPLNKGTQVIELLSKTINGVRCGEMDPRVANCIGYLSNILLKALEHSDMEERLSELEGLVKRPPGQQQSLYGMDPCDDAFIFESKESEHGTEKTPDQD